jgi:hypothetical protein
MRVVLKATLRMLLNNGFGDNYLDTHRNKLTSL